jgi:hypothetical protein
MLEELRNKEKAIISFVRNLENMNALEQLKHLKATAFKVRLVPVVR